MEPSYLVRCLYSLNDVYSHLWKIKVFCNKINKISVIVVFVRQWWCFSDLFSGWLQLYLNTVLGPNPSQSIPQKEKRKIFYVLVWPRWERKYSSVQHPLHTTWGRSLPHSWKSPVSSIVTSTAFAKRTSHFYVSLARFQTSRWQIYDLNTEYSHVRLFRL